MKRIVVTSGVGFIGSAVCRYLVKRKCVSVLNVDKLTDAGNRLRKNEYGQYLLRLAADAVCCTVRI
jgi:dTDP-glucose 4,6-dehydratase